MGDFEKEFDDFIAELQEHIDEKDRQDYSEYALELIKHPYKKGNLTKIHGVYPYSDSSDCGDAVTYYFLIKDDTIADVGFDVDGCAVSAIASSQVMTMIDGKSLPEARSLTTKQVLTAIGRFPPESVHAIAFAVKMLYKALDNYPNFADSN